MISPARVAAYEVLRAVARGRVDAATALANTRAVLPDPRDRALAAELVLGTLRWRGALDHVIAWAGNRPPDRFDPEVLDILRLGAYQLFHLDRVPASAVVDDAVNLAKRAKRRSASGAVNAILRRLSRSRRDIPMPAEDAPLEFLSVTLSQPRWLAARWMNRSGYAAARACATFHNEAPPVTLRANALRISRADLAAALGREGITTEPARYAPDGLVVTGGAPLASPLLEAGAFFVQDEASQLVGAFAAPRRGDRVLDACAAPGGKTTHMASLMGDDGLVVASDERPRRVTLLADTIRRSGASCIRVVRTDVARPLPFAASFDLVLLDAPCSGLGTIRRDPDVKWRRREADLPRLADTQRRMLQHAAAAVRPGGRLVYSTCSSEPEENDLVVEAFLHDHPAFEAADPRTVGCPLAPGVTACLDERGRLRTTPQDHGLEAFFGVWLVRREAR